MMGAPRCFVISTTKAAELASTSEVWDLLRYYEEVNSKVTMSEFSSDEETNNERTKVFPGIFLLDVNEEQI